MLDRSSKNRGIVPDDVATSLETPVLGSISLDQSSDRRTLEFHVHASFVSRFLLLIAPRNRPTVKLLSRSLSLSLSG